MLGKKAVKLESSVRLSSQRSAEVRRAPGAPRNASGLRGWLAYVVCTCALVTGLWAQKTEKFTRKLIYRENPGYPLTLREAHIGGVVRLEILISAKGTVDQISPLGGNPVLVEAASNAVKKWKYAPSDAESKTEVEFTFDPRR
jgi:TonB family protein